MTKKQIRIFSYYDEVYEVHHLLAVTPNYADAARVASKIEANHSFEPEDVTAATELGRCTFGHIKGKPAILVWMPEFKRTARHIAILVHELRHVESFVKARIQHAMPDNPQDEAWAYYIEYLTRKSLEFLI